MDAASLGSEGGRDELSATWLLKCGFAGVQEFISQSRKVRDLAAGSWWIQTLARRIAEVSAGTPGVTVLLPTSPARACTHQLVVRLGQLTEPKCRAFAEGLANEARRVFSATGMEQLRSAKIGILKRQTVLGEENEWRLQLDDALEMFWVAVPETGNYSADFTRLSLAYDSRRYSRTFPPLPTIPDFLGTCRQCGSRPAILRFAGSARSFFNGRDQLCPVCLARRVSARRRGAVLSTLALGRDRVFRLPAFQSVISDLAELGIRQRDEQLDFLEWLEDTTTSGGAGNEPPQVVPPDDVAQLLRFETARDRLLGVGDNDRRGREGRPRFDNLAPYYAIVVFDGDEMGRWFGGYYFHTTADLEVNQRRLGEALADFADSLSDLESRHAVQLIYAGGDDAFILCPLDAALPLVAALRVLWLSKVAAPLHGLAQDDRVPTFSAHVSLVHEHAPLQAAVRRLQRLLTQTKDEAGRDAFSVLADVRAGQPILFLEKFKYLDEFIRVVESFTNWRAADLVAGVGCKPPATESEMAARARNRFAGRLPYKLAADARVFFDDKGHCISHDGLRRDIQRVLMRDNADLTTQRTRFLDWAAHRYDLQRDPWAHHSLDPREAWMSALETVAFLARVLDWPADQSLVLAAVGANA